MEFLKKFSLNISKKLERQRVTVEDGMSFYGLYGLKSLGWFLDMKQGQQPLSESVPGRPMDTMAVIYQTWVCQETGCKQSLSIWMLVYSMLKSQTWSGTFTWHLHLYIYTSFKLVLSCTAKQLLSHTIHIDTLIFHIIVLCNNSCILYHLLSSVRF